jgi:hypothetical protein
MLATLQGVQQAEKSRTATITADIAAAFNRRVQSS